MLAFCLKGKQWHIYGKGKVSGVSPSLQGKDLLYGVGAFWAKGENCGERVQIS